MRKRASFCAKAAALKSSSWGFPSPVPLFFPRITTCPDPQLTTHTLLTFSVFAPCSLEKQKTKNDNKPFKKMSCFYFTLSRPRDGHIVRPLPLSKVKLSWALTTQPLQLFPVGKEKIKGKGSQHLFSCGCLAWACNQGLIAKHTDRRGSSQ